MRARCLVALCGVAWLAGAGPPAKPDPATNLVMVQPGMGMARVRELLGDPDRVSRQVLFRRHIEQWAYPGSPSPRVEFDCPRNGEPRVSAVFRGR